MSLPDAPRAAVGRITQVVGPVVDVAFPPQMVPEILHALHTTNPNINERGDNLVLEVVAHLGGGAVRTLAMDTTDGLRRGQEVCDSGAPIRIPVGRELLGRLVNVIGEAIDGLGPVSATALWPIYRLAPSWGALPVAAEPFETGIKAIDLLAPIPKGGKLGLVGWELGKLLLVKELAYTLAKRQGGCSVFAGVGIRASEMNDLWLDMQAGGERAVLFPGDIERSKVALVCAQSSATPGARARVALSALTLAEYFRDEQGRDVLLFIDDLLQLTQACAEVSTLLGQIPSAVGQSPSLSADISALQERIRSASRGSITSIQSIALPADLAHPAVSAVREHLDGTVVLSRRLAEIGSVPAVDPLVSTSRTLDSAAVPSEHTRVAREVKQLLSWYQSLGDILGGRSLDELSREDGRRVARARKVQFFLSQPLHVAEQFTGCAGAFVEIGETVRGFKEILEGRHDDLPEDAFILCGTIGSVCEKAARLEASG